MVACYAFRSRIKHKHNLGVRYGSLCDNSDTQTAGYAICGKYAGQDSLTPDTIGLVRACRTGPTMNYSRDNAYRCDGTGIILPLGKMFSIYVKRQCVNEKFVLGTRDAGYEFDDVVA